MTSEVFEDAKLAEVRDIVEPVGARLAAQRLTRGELTALDHALQAMTDVGKVGEAAVEADLTFHRALLAAAHNDLLQPMAAVIETGLRARDRLVHGNAACADPIPSHKKVVDAVHDHAPDAAEAAMRELLAIAERDVRRTLRRQQKRDADGQAR